MVRTELTPEEVALWERWQQRVAEGNFSEGIAGTRTVRVMGRAGDAPVKLPTLADIGWLPTLEPDEQFALDYGDRLVKGFAARGRSLFSDGSLISRFDPTDRNDIIVLTPIAGG